MAVNRELDRFLESVERRAFIKARLATGNEQEALDIVQDAMFKLVRSYSSKAVDDWGPLFQRILQSRITDWYRRQAARNRLFAWFTKSIDEDTGYDSSHLLEAADKGQPEPWENMNGAQLTEVLQQAIHQLPLRQQQAFILRQWDGLSVADAARVMGCTRGSVKTHCSRALGTLRHTLQKLDVDAQTND